MESSDEGEPISRSEEGEEEDDEAMAESSSSGSDSEQEREAEKALDGKIEQLETALNANPPNYDSHVELVNVLRRSGRLEELRNARERMNAHFPLTPTMWQEWVKDEARLVSSAEDILAVEALFERGIQEYLSVSLWLDYLEFTQKYDALVTQYTVEGISKMRTLYERALSPAGLHFTEGIKIWESYRHFEQTVLSNMLDAMPEAKMKQVECVRTIFRRQLSVPQSDFTELLKDYKEWESQQGNIIGDEADELAGLPTNVSLVHRKAVQMSLERQAYEEKVSKGKPADAELLQNFLAYITLEEATCDPARAQVVYERAVGEFPVTDELWKKYTQYLETNLKVSSVIRSVYARAVRNCPWVQSLWSGYLLALERSNASESEVSMVFEQSMGSGFGFSSPNEYLEHFLTRVDGLRRRVNSISDENEERKACLTVIRETFNRALQLLSSLFPEYVDRSLRLFSYWANLESKVANDLVAARGVWESLLKTSGWMTEAWQGYISMEIMLGNIKDARTLYKRCYSRRLEGNGTEVICEAWLRFERENGSLEDYDRAILKVKPRLAEVRLLQQQQETKAAQSSLTNSVDKHINTSKASQAKRKSEQIDSHHTEMGNKKMKCVKVETRIESKQKSQSENSEVLPNEQTKLQNSQSEPKELTPKKQTAYTDECTVFVSNIPLEVTEEVLKDFFSSCGGLKEVRLLKNRYNGRSRGLAYVDLTDEKSLAAAVAKNKQKLQGQRLSIARSDPAKVRDKGGEHGGKGRNPEGKAKGYHPSEGATTDAQASHGGREQPITAMHRRGGHVQLAGRNTFAAPRAVVRPLGFSAAKKGPQTVTEEAPKSNEEFRKMLLQKP